MDGDGPSVGLRLMQRTDDRATAPPRLRMSVGRLAVGAAFALAVLLPQTTLAQQNKPPAAAPQSQWAKLPRMQLVRQFAGPLQDTIIQVWRDPADGVLCYIYLPITVQHSAPVQSGYVQYGANTLGSISCFSGPRKAETRAKRPIPLHQ